MITDSEILDLLNLECASQGISVVTQMSPDFLASLEANGSAWAKYFFPKLLSRDFTFYQDDFWDWVSSVQPGIAPRPRVECEPRGVGKSTNSRAGCVNWLARQVRRYILYICATETQAEKHFSAIKQMLEFPRLLEAYPHLSPKIQTHRNAVSNWSSERLVTAGGQVVEFISLLGNARGFTTEEGNRPDVMVLDDIDDQKDSPHIVAKKIDILSTSLLPAGTDETLILFPQNLIHRDSVCTQIRDQRADILSNRIFVGAYPLMKWYDAEKRPIEGDDTGAEEWVITDGEALDPAIDIPYCNELLNKLGKRGFDRECQQKVEEIEDDKDFREWKESFHLITQSEFINTFTALKEPVWNAERQKIQIPARWEVGIGLDWGTTIAHPSVSAFIGRPGEMSPLKNCQFVFGEVCLPKYPHNAHEAAELVSPGRVSKAINELLKEWNVQESQLKARFMSHEASAALNTMLIDLPAELQQFFAKWKAQKGSGVPQIQNLLEINHTKQHPFRRYPKGHKKEGQPLQGSPRIFFVVADGQGELRVDQNGEMYVVGAKDSKGFARARFEMPLYSHKNQGQKKTNDDFVDGFRGVMSYFGVAPYQATTKEVMQEKMAKLTPFAGEQKDDMSTAADISRQMASQFALQEMRKEGFHTDRWGNDLEPDDLSDISGGW